MASMALGERAHGARGKGEFFDGRAAGGDASFAVNGAAVFDAGNEVNVRKRGKERCGREWRALCC